MSRETRSRERIRDYFRRYPDYPFCRALADNVEEGVLSEAEALRTIAVKAEAALRNRERIDEVLDAKVVRSRGRSRRLKGMRAGEIVALEEAAFVEAVRFYFKHPYAHGRTIASRWVPRWIRTWFLRVLFGHATRRGAGLELDEMKTILDIL